MAISWDIPPTWGTKKLGDIAPENSTQVRPYERLEATFNYWGLDAIDAGEVEEPAPNFIQGSEVSSSCMTFDTSHVLYAKLRPYLNKVIVPTIEGIGSTEWVAFKPNPAVINRHYLAYVLRTSRFVRYAEANSTGARMPRVRKSALWVADIPLPYPDDSARSLVEQRRIVARIQAFLGEVREARKLQHALSSNTETLMTACIQEIFGQPNSHWQTSILSDVATVQTGIAKGGWYGGAPLVEIPYLRVANVQAGFLDLTEIKTISLPSERIERYRLYPGDLLLTEGGDYDKLGRGAVWEGQIDPCIHQNHVFAVRFDKETIAPRLAEYEMQSRTAKDYFLSVAKKTTNLASINKTQLSNFPIRYPATLDEQRQIVHYLDSIQREIMEIQKSQSEERGLVDAMEQAILAQAFRGEL